VDLEVRSASDTLLSREGVVLSSSGCLYVRASGWALTALSPAFQRRAISGSEAWVLMLGSDLVVGVIGLTTLRLAHLHIVLSFSGLVS
jgi:hypothetical protein